MMKNAYFMLNALFILEIFTFFTFFCYVGKQLDKKAENNFKIYDVTDWTTNNYNTHLNISRSKANQAIKFGQSIKYNLRKIYL